MQPADVIFPDIELWATGYLRSELAARPETYADDVFVSNAVPANRRARMVIVRRDGGPRLTVATEAARLGVRVWSPTEQNASDLARLVRALLWASPDGNPVVSARDFAGPTAVADESGVPMRYFTLELIVRGTPLDVES